MQKCKLKKGTENRKEEGDLADKRRRTRRKREKREKKGERRTNRMRKSEGIFEDWRNDVIWAVIVGLMR